METLSKIFGSEAKVKIMRLFLFNSDHQFSLGEVSDRGKVSSSQARKEISLLEKAGLIKSRSNGTKKTYTLDQHFGYLVPLQNFLVNVEPLSSKDIVKRITKLGSIKLIIVSGVFTQEPESRVDMLVVGDHIKKGSMENIMKTLESEVGKELRYAYFTTDDFQYRISMCDKLTRDILDYPHKKILNKLNNI